MLFYQNDHLIETASGTLAVHGLIDSLDKRPGVNAISVNEYLLARAYASASDRDALDEWLIGRLKQAAQSCERPQITVAGRHAQQIIKRWLDTFAVSVAVSEAVRQAAQR